MSTSILDVMKSLVPISLFNKGYAGKIFSDVRRNGAKLVVKNNVPECVLISPEEYTKMVEELNDARLLGVASYRMEHFDHNQLVPQNKVDEILGVSENDLIGFEEVEIE